MTQLKGLDTRRIASAKSFKVGSPVFPVEWCKLGTPQTGGEYDGEYGKYRFDLVIDPATEEGAKFVERINKQHDACLAAVTAWKEANGSKGKKVTNFRESPLKTQERKVTDPAEAKELGIEVGDRVETGKYVLKFSMPAAKTRKSPDGDIRVIYMKPKVTDTKRRDVPKGVLDTIGNGSLVRVAFDHRPYIINDAAGSSVSIGQVILIKVKEYGAVDVDDYFTDLDSTESSYSVGAVSAADNYESPDSDENDDEDGDF